ncbi:MAG: SpoIIE family protein phosphatase [Myxococcota bacterium]
MMGRLRETDGGSPGRTYELKDVCVLGRAMDCQVHIRDLTVSRRHARISKVDGRYMIEDLGSGNGTYVNEEAVTRRFLSHSDVIRVSNARFRFEQLDRRSDSVTMAGPKESAPRIVTTVDARTSLLAKPEASSPKDVARLASRLQTVYAVSEAISSVLDVDELLTEILNRLFEVFPRADRGFIMLRNESGDRLIPKAVKRRRTGDVEELVVSRTILQQVLQKQQAVLTHDASEDSRFKKGQSVAQSGIRAMLAAPLVYRSEAVGIVYLDSPGIAAFQSADLELLSGISRQAAVALGNARLHSELLKRQRLERDLHLAERIQQSFLPRKLPKMERFTFCARYDPAYEVGGDFYDFVKLDEDRLGIVVGDVSGKGVGAALYMARLTRDLRYYALAEREPKRVLARLNQAVVEGGQDDIFVTLVYGVLDGPRRVLEWSSAGHMPPILRRRNEGEVRALDCTTEAGLPLGVMPDATYDSGLVELSAGDTVLIYTDGLIEAMSPEKEMFGQERLLACLGEGSSHADAVLERAIEACSVHVGAAPQFDDTTIVCAGLDYPEDETHEDVQALD